MTKPNKSTSDRVYISKGIPYTHIRSNHMRAPIGILHGEWTSSFLCMSVNDNINSLGPRQNRRHFADDVFKCNLLNENV